MYVLGIESTCDETAAAVVQNGRKILSNVVSSQIDLHREYGGVVPELACRRHVDVLLPVIEQALYEANATLQQIDLIAVAHGPGLIGAVLLGLSAAKALSLGTGIPFVGVNHIEAHLYASLMQEESPAFPCLGVVLSGGHTHLVKVEEVGQYALIGQTVDDAVGEAFDKAAQMMGLPYPGGPVIEKLAAKGNPARFTFKAGNIKDKPFDFSFSGLKTALLYTIQNMTNKDRSKLTAEDKADLAAAFQKTAFDCIISKSVKATKSLGCSDILLGGGVTNNLTLRHLFQEAAPELRCWWPPKGLSLDNAAMIAGLGYHQFKTKGTGDAMDLEPVLKLGMVTQASSK